MRKIYFYLLFSILGVIPDLSCINAFAMESAQTMDDLHQELFNKLKKYKSTNQIIREVQNHVGKNYHQAAQDLVNQLEPNDTDDDINDVLEKYEKRAKTETSIQSFATSFIEAIKRIQPDIDNAAFNAPNAFNTPNTALQHVHLRPGSNNQTAINNPTANRPAHSSHNSSNQQSTPAQTILGICIIGGIIIGIYYLMQDSGNEKTAENNGTNFSTKNRYNLA